jgi:cytoskeletal protein RodZ
MTRDPERQVELMAAAGAFGRWLSQERELRGLEADEVARQSKLGNTIITSLESGDPDRMPPKAYVFGYLRSYATVVGLDPDDVVLRWQEVVGPEEKAARARRPVPVQTVLGAAVAVVVAVLAALAIFGAPRERAPLKLDRPRAVERAPYASEPPGR